LLPLSVAVRPVGAGGCARLRRAAPRWRGSRRAGDRARPRVACRL